MSSSNNLEIMKNLSSEILNVSSNSVDNLPVCGALDCPNEISNANSSDVEIVKPPQSLVSTLVGVYVGFGALSILLIIIFLDKVDKETQETEATQKCSSEVIVSAFKHMRNKYQIMLIPLTVFTGVQQAYMVADYTRSFLACTLGVDKIGLVVVVYGVVAAIVSVSCSYFVKKVGRIPIFFAAYLTQLSCLIINLYWRPNLDQVYIFFLVSSLWALGDSIWQAQLNAVYGSLFSETSESAFSNYRLWESLGWIISLSYSSILCMYLKTYIVIGFLTAGFVCYCLAEYVYWREEKQLSENAEKPLGADELLTESSALSSMASQLRRKSMVYVPEVSVQNAATIIRRKSTVAMLQAIRERENDSESEQLTQDEQITNITHRRLSLFVPLRDITGENVSNTSRAGTPRGSPYNSPVLARKLRARTFNK